MSEAAGIDTAAFGCALAFKGPGKAGNNSANWWVKFDTGVIMYLPEPLFMLCTFSLEEKDPELPVKK